MRFCPSCSRLVDESAENCPACAAKLVTVPELDFAPPGGARSGAGPFASPASGAATAAADSRPRAGAGRAQPARAPGAGAGDEPRQGGVPGRPFSPATFAAQAEMSAEDIEPIRLELMDEPVRRPARGAPAPALPTAPMAPASAVPAPIPDRARFDLGALRRRYGPALLVVAIVLGGALALKLLALLLEVLGISAQ